MDNKNLSLTLDNSRRTRSRSNSTSDGNTLREVYFNKPHSIVKPGTYLLNGERSVCSITLFDSIFPQKYLTELQTNTDSLTTLVQPLVINGTKTTVLPRLSAWYGPTDYKFSGVTMPAHNITEAPNIISAYKLISEKLLTPNGIENNADSFLLNRYRTGKDSCGEHADNEPIIHQNSPIITFSLGNPRTMLIRESMKPGNAISVTLNPGSVLVINGANFQANFTHQIPKESVVTPSRTSVTYRKCDPNFLLAQNSMSRSIYQLDIPQTDIIHPIWTDIQSPTDEPKKRRSSSFSLGSSRSTSPLATRPTSPLAHSTYSPSSANSVKSTDSRISSSDSNELPLSLQALLEAIDHLKDTTIKKELQRHDLLDSGTILDKRKRLKKAVRDSHRKFIVKSLSFPEPNNSSEDCIVNAINTLENSIVGLSEEIVCQRTSIEAIDLTNQQPAQPIKSPNNTLANDINAIKTRIEKIEDIMSSIKTEQTDMSKTVSDNKNELVKISQSAAESCSILRTSATKTYDEQNHSATKNSTPHKPNNMRQDTHKPRSYSSNRSRLKPHKVLLLHDSQLNSFAPNNFSSNFLVEKYKAGSYDDLLNKHMRNIISKPGIDCYAVELGINDIRFSPSSTKVNKAVSNTKASLKRLLSMSSAKVLVCLPTPTPGALDKYTLDYCNAVTDVITELRGENNYYNRLFTLSNHSNFLKTIDEQETVVGEEKTKVLSTDLLHLSSFGVKKLCSNIKFGLFRCFGKRFPRMQIPEER